MNHNFVPCEGGEHAIADQYLFAHLVIGRRELANGNTEKASKYSEKGRYCHSLSEQAFGTTVNLYLLNSLRL